MIIDFHTHVSIGEGREETVEGLDRTLALAHRANIDKIVLLGNVFRGGIRGNAEAVRAANDETIRFVAHRPDQVYGFCYVNPLLDPGFLREEISRCISEGGFRGIKLEADMNVRDGRMATVMEEALKHGVPILQHAWYKTTAKEERESDPLDIADLAERYPENIIIMAHLAACGIRGVLDVERFENVYVDTSGSQPFAGFVEYGVEKLGADRIVFGSDITGRDFGCQLAKVTNADISNGDREKILWKNALRLLKVDEATRE